MLIRDYFAIQNIHKDDRIEIFICRKSNEDGSNKLFTVSKLINDKMIYESMPYFLELKKNRKFTDFVDCFTQEGSFYAVFKYCGRPSVTDRVKNSRIYLIEKINYVKELLSRLAILNMPHAMMYECLDYKNIVFDESGSVFFNYVVTDYANYKNITRLMAMKRLSGVLGDIFSRETEKNINLNLAPFIQSVKDGKYKDVFGVYVAYMNIYEELNNYISLQKKEKEGFIARFISRGKKIIDKLKPLLAALIIIAGIGFLIYTMRKVNTPEAVPAGNIKNIGTIDILEY